MSVDGFEPRSSEPKSRGLTSRPPRLCEEASIIDAQVLGSLLEQQACVFCLLSRGTDLNLPGSWYFNCHGRLFFCFAHCIFPDSLSTRLLAPPVCRFSVFLTVGLPNMSAPSVLNCSLPFKRPRLLSVGSQSTLSTHTCVYSLSPVSYVECHRAFALTLLMSYLAQ